MYASQDMHDSIRDLPDAPAELLKRFRELVEDLQGCDRHADGDSEEQGEYHNCLIRAQACARKARTQGVDEADLTEAASELPEDVREELF